AFEKGKFQLCAKPARKLSDLFTHILRLDARLCEKLARVRLRHEAVLAPEGIEHAVLRVKVGVLLIVVADAHEFCMLHTVALTQKILQKRRLARTVFARERAFFAAQEGKVCVFDEEFSVN